MTTVETISLLLGSGVTWAMAGVAWLVQGLIYPQFRRVDAANWVAYHAAHTRAMGLVVGPLMVLELVTAAHWTALWLMGGALPGWLALGALGLTAATWALTFGWAVPLHHRLAQEYRDDWVWGLLINNGWRTALWTGKAGLVGVGLWCGQTALG